MSASVGYEDHRGPARQGPQAFFHGPELKSERPQAPGDEETAGCDATDKGLGVSRATF